MTEDNNVKDKMNTEAKMPSLSKHSLIGRWIRQILVSPSLSVGMIMGTEERNVEPWLANIIGEPSPGYYLIEIYEWVDNGDDADWIPSHQELRRIEELHGSDLKLFNTIDEALNPRKITTGYYRFVEMDTAYGPVGVQVNSFVHGLTNKNTVRFTFSDRQLPTNTDIEWRMAQDFDKSDEVAKTDMINVCRRLDDEQHKHQVNSYTAVQKLIAIRRLIESDESLNDIVASIRSVLDPK